MTEKSELENEFECTVEFDDETGHAHYFFAHSVDVSNPSVLKFDPLHELGHEIDRAIVGETYMIPYLRVVRVIRRKGSE